MALSFDGEDRVESHVEQAFSLGFPAFRSHADQRTRRYPPVFNRQPLPEPAARRILFVEDDRFIADMYRMRLESDGWEVDVATDGEAGLRQALKAPPALILLDILLPRLDGIELLRELRADETTRDVPVLIVSNAAGLSGRETEARELGIVDWLVKANTSPAKLAERVGRILGN
jgi:DNA-binding response OmpR family regulator